MHLARARDDHAKLIGLKRPNCGSPLVNCYGARHIWISSSNLHNIRTSEVTIDVRAFLELELEITFFTSATGMATHSSSVVSAVYRIRSFWSFIFISYFVELEISKPQQLDASEWQREIQPQI